MRGRRRPRAAVGPLAPSSTSLALMRLRALGGDLAFERGRDQDVAVDVPERLVVDRARAPLKPAMPPSRCSDGASASAMSKPLRVDERAGVVLHRDDLRAGLRRTARPPTLPTLPKPCTATRAPSRSRPMRRAASRPVTKTPRPVALTRPSEPPRCIGLPVTTPVAVGAGVHRVRVHHPGHDLAVGVHVGRRDVAAAGR